MAELRADPRAADPRWQAMTDNLGRAFAELDLEGDGNKHAVALSDCLSIVARERSQKFCKRRCNSPSLKRPDSDTASSVLGILYRLLHSPDTLCPRKLPQTRPSERLAYGARALTEGGWRAVAASPRKTGT